MKRVIFDHNVPARLARFLKAFDIMLAGDLGWAELRNGRLLRAAEDSGFHVLLTGDKTMHYEQNIDGFKIGVVSMSDNHLRIVLDYVPAISEAIEKVKPGQVLPVFCGRFARVKFKQFEP